MIQRLAEAVSQERKRLDEICYCSSRMIDVRTAPFTVQVHGPNDFNQHPPNNYSWLPEDALNRTALSATP